MHTSDPNQPQLAHITVETPVDEGLYVQSLEVISSMIIFTAGQMKSGNELHHSVLLHK